MPVENFGFCTWKNIDKNLKVVILHSFVFINRNLAAREGVVVVRF